MNGEVLIAASTSFLGLCSIVTAAIIKFVPRRNYKNNCGATEKLFISEMEALKGWMRSIENRIINLEKIHMKGRE